MAERKMKSQGRRPNGHGTEPKQRADGRWQSSIWITDPATGERKRLPITKRTAQDVYDAMDEIRLRQKAGHAAQDSRQTLAMWIEQSWISMSLASRDVSKRTREMYASTARQHIADSAIGRLPLDKLRVSHMKGWIVEQRDDRKLAPSTIRGHYTVLKAVLDDAVADGLITVSPLQGVPRPAVPENEAAHLSYEQASAALDAMGDTRHAQIVELLLNTGMRRGECLGMQWGDIDFDERTMKVQRSISRIGGRLQISPPKTRAGKRTLHLNDDAVEILRTVRAQQRVERMAARDWETGDFVFTTTTGKPIDPSCTLKAFQKAARSVGIEQPKLHMLRHTAATWMLRNGVHMKTVQIVLGHASMAVTANIYSHVDPDIAIDALASLSGLSRRKGA